MQLQTTAKSSAHAATWQNQTRSWRFHETSLVLVVWSRFPDFIFVVSLVYGVFKVSFICVQSDRNQINRNE